jgi:hypothetical protein
MLDVGAVRARQHSRLRDDVTSNATDAATGSRAIPAPSFLYEASPRAGTTYSISSASRHRPLAESRSAARMTPTLRKPAFS